MVGMSLSVICTAANTFFHFRTPAPFISPFIVQILAYPIGSFLAWATPLWSFTMPRWLGGKELQLNPGPFNIKEHSIIIIMANVGIGPAYGLHAVVSSELWYGRQIGPWFNILFILSTQLTGFTFAGLCRRFVVWPASMIWPSVLVAATSLNTFHAENEGFQGSMTRFRFFIITGSCAFAYYFLPGKTFVVCMCSANTQGFCSLLCHTFRMPAGSRQTIVWSTSYSECRPVSVTVCSRSTGLKSLGSVILLPPHGGLK